MPNAELQEMCVKAIAAHAAWKAKFKQLLAGKATLVSATTRRSDVCEFGKWLAGTGRAQLGAAFSAIDAAHKKFHVIAADVIDAHKAGRTEQVSKELGFGGGFARASADLTQLIVDVRNKAG